MNVYDFDGTIKKISNRIKEDPVPAGSFCCL